MIEFNNANYYDRNDYLSGKVSHNEYYKQFVTDELMAYVSGYIGKERIIASNEEYLNDIPLKEWDALISVKSKINTKLFKTCENVTYGECETSFFWSLSNQVTIAKTAARIIKERIYYDNSIRNKRV